MQATDTPAPPSQAASLADWLRLTLTPGVGRNSAARLLDHFTTPGAIFQAPLEALAAIVPRARAQLLCRAPDPAVAAAIAHALAWAGRPGQHVLARDDPRYPPLLGQIADPPALLYVVGEPAWLQGPALAMVGSRNASAQGVANARAFAQALSAAGITIVSGLALGIDAAAHQGGLDGPGSTVAVIGTGADRIYPARNGVLARRIAAEGCIVSEYALGTPPQPANFPRRNRLISGLCCGVLVVEAAARSGSLITAHLAAEQGREVFAIPGSIHAPLAKGCHKLIKEGARLVESAADLFEELRLSPLCLAGGEGGAGAPVEHPALLAALGQDPVDADVLAERTGMAAATLSSQLLTLELAGQVERLPGGLFQRIYR